MSDAGEAIRDALFRLQVVMINHGAGDADFEVALPTWALARVTTKCLPLGECAPFADGNALYGPGGRILLSVTNRANRDGECKHGAQLTPDGGILPCAHPDCQRGARCGTHLLVAVRAEDGRFETLTYERAFIRAPDIHGWENRYRWVDPGPRL